MSKFSRISAYFLMSGLLLTSVSGCNVFQGGQSKPSPTVSVQERPSSPPSSSQSGAGTARTEVLNKLQPTRNALNLLKQQFPTYQESTDFYLDAQSKINNFENHYKNLIQSLPDHVKNGGDFTNKNNQIMTSTQQVKGILDLLVSRGFMQAQDKLVTLKFLAIDKKDGDDGSSTRQATRDLLKNWAGEKELLSSRSLYKEDLNIAKSLGELETLIINKWPNQLGLPTPSPTATSTLTTDDPPASSINWTMLYLFLVALLALNGLTLWILFMFNNRKIFIRVEELKQQDEKRLRSRSSSFDKLHSLVGQIEKINDTIGQIRQDITEIKKANKNGVLDEAALSELQEKLSSLDHIQEEINWIFLETVYQLTPQSKQFDDSYTNEYLQQFITLLSSLQNKITDLIQTNNSKLNTEEINFLLKEIKQKLEQEKTDSNPERIKELEEKILESFQENEELKKQVDDLTQQLAQEKAEEQTQFNPEQIQELEGQVSKLIEENEELKKQVDDLTQQLAQEKAEEQTQFNPEQIQELEGQISKLIQDNQVKVTDLEKQLNTEKEQYEAKLAELEEQNKNLDAAISRLERELKELKILSPTSPSSHLPPLVVQLVGFFNQSPQSLLNEIDKYKYHEVTETAKSSRERRGSVDSKDVVLETPETCIGDFLIVEIGKGSSYLFPKYQLISEGLAQTAKALFKGYSDKTSFELIRPAKVSFIGGNWKLDEQGELKHNN
jgi:hypothetical protein